MALKQAEIGERIARLRRERGNPPQEVVAQAIGVSYRSLQSWEAGSTKPSYRNLVKLADYFGVSEEYILMGEIDPTAPRNLTQLDRVEETLRQLVERQEAIEAAVADLAEALVAALPQAQPGRRQSSGS